MRRFVAFIFLTIFSFQLLPVRAIGKLFAKSQQTEEVKDSCSDDSCDDDAIDDFFFFAHSDLAGTYAPETFKKPEVFCADDNLPPSHVGEIVCPPPNA